MNRTFNVPGSDTRACYIAMSNCFLQLGVSPLKMLLVSDVALLTRPAFLSRSHRRHNHGVMFPHRTARFCRARGVAICIPRSRRNVIVGLFRGVVNGQVMGSWAGGN